MLSMKARRLSSVRFCAASVVSCIAASFRMSLRVSTTRRMPSCTSARMEAICLSCLSRRSVTVISVGWRLVLVVDVGDQAVELVADLYQRLVNVSHALLVPLLAFTHILQPDLMVHLVGGESFHPLLVFLDPSRLACLDSVHHGHALLQISHDLLVVPRHTARLSCLKP